ncbi:MAG: fibronectin type III domain-containing protein [Streptosporangiaceae bacterium]
MQVSGNGGVPSDAAGAALFIGAANASATGFVSAYPAGGSASTVAILRYTPTRVSHDLYIGALSSTGNLTLVNHGSAPVDLMVGVEGYLVSPSATEAGGAYQGVAQSRIVDTRNGTGGVPATPVPAGGSITFSATGVNDVPATGALSVSESVAALNATNNGFLSVYPAGAPDPNEPGVNFNAGDGQDNDMATPLLSAVSQTGQETITNHSSGTVDVVVSVRGYYLSSVAPSAPESVSDSVSGSSATVTWSPPASDGGAAITSYRVAAGPDDATVTVWGTTATQATLTGLAHASADVFAVTAVNAAGSSETGLSAPPAVLSGTVLSPNGQPVNGATVVLTPSDVPPSSPTEWTPSIVGTATTDANGIWTFTVPPYSSLPADAQADADANGGSLNLTADAEAWTTSGTTSYNMDATAAFAAYVGTSASPAGPVQVATPGSGVPSMIVMPAQADLSSQDTFANEQATIGYQSDPTLTDSGGNFIGNEMNAYATPSTDPYGYMNIAGPNNDGYSPFIAADGTDLSTATATATPPPSPAIHNCTDPHVGYTTEYSHTLVWDQPRYAIVGEFHSNWNTNGIFKYETHSESSISVGISADGEHFHFGGMATFTLEKSGEDTLSGASSTGGTGSYTSHHISIALNFAKIKKQGWWVPNTDGDVDNTDPAKEASGEPSGDNIKCGVATYYIQEGGLYDPPGSTIPYIRVDCKRLSSGYCSSTDNSLWSNMDGENGYNNALPHSYRYRAAYLAGSQSHCDSTGKGYLYKIAATIGNFDIEAETGHKTITDQCIDFGTGGPRYDVISGKKDSTHWLWGSNTQMADGPKVFYSY